MRSKLSYYSLVLLGVLAVASGLVLAVNPFGVSTSASPGSGGPTSAASPSSAQSSVSTHSAPFVAGDGHRDGDRQQPPSTGNGGSATTSVSIHSQDE